MDCVHNVTHYTVTLLLNQITFTVKHNTEVTNNNIILVLFRLNEEPLLIVIVNGFSKEISKTKLHSLSPRANYTDRATAACRRSDCQRLLIDGATWSA
jgi:hypothetical protein